MSQTLSARLGDALRTRGPGIALVAEGGRTVSGAELHERASDLADRLKARGLRPGDHVAFLVDRSADSIVAILATIYAGCAYVPLESAAPTFWLEHIIDTVGPRALLYTRETEQIASRIRRLPLDAIGLPLSAREEDEHRAAFDAGREAGDSERLAYIMGTSGSTGLPKAVPVRSSSLVHYCDAFADRVRGEIDLAGLRVASATTLAADLGNTMIFPSLLFGGELHLIPYGVSRDPQRFKEYVRHYAVDGLKVVPTQLRVLLAQGRDVLPRRLLVVGGEPFGLDLLEQLELHAPDCAVFNHYGPTEATIGVAMFRVHTMPGTADRLRLAGLRTVPIGTALGDNDLRIVDDRLQPCGDGVRGELVVTGPSVSAGYLGESEVLDPRFIDTGHPDNRTYRTGDLARVTPTGDIELFGRADRQFKVRGYRVDAAGVEEQLRTHPAVLDAFVDHRANALGGGLVAWVHTDERTDESALRGFLADRLPEAAVPGRILVTGALPRTPNGKIDTKGLSEPNARHSATAMRSVEEAVRLAMAQVLELPLAATDGNFFRIGGHSLAALQVIDDLRERHGLGLTVAEFYANPTPAGIARAVRPYSLAPVGMSEGQVSPQVHALWTHLHLHPNDATYEIPIRLRIKGAGADRERVHHALIDLVMRHDALRTRFSRNDGKPVPVVDADGRATLKLMEHDTPPESPLLGLDITSGPLMIARIHERGAHDCVVDLLVHHLVFDGASGGVIVRELATLLGGDRAGDDSGSGNSLSRHPASKYRQPPAMDSEPAPLGDGPLARFGWPLSQPGRMSRNLCQALPLPEDLWKRVETCAAALDTTAFALLSAAWAFVLSRQDGERSLTIGTPIDLRDRVTERRLVGYHTNIVVIPIEVRHDDTVRTLVQRTHIAVSHALEERHRPYASRVAHQRAAAGTAPTRTLLTIDRLERASSGNIDVRQEPLVRARPIFDVDVTVTVGDEAGETLHIHHREAVCREGRARCVGDQLIHVLDRFTANPQLMVNDLGILPPAWEERVKAWSHAAPVPLPEAWGAHAFIEQASAEPGAPAVMWQGSQWSRRELVESIAHTARVLRECGLGPGHAVATTIAPSPALAIAWHAIHLAGAAVLPLDPDWPDHRLTEAMRRARVDVRLTSLDGLVVDVAGTAAAAAPHTPDLAYLVLTSGSTGSPKLVAIGRSALAHELAWYPGVFAIGGDDRVLAYSSPGFDVSAWEMLGFLSNGACLVFPALNRRTDVTHLADILREKAVTVLFGVPSLLEALLVQLAHQPPMPQPGASLRLLISGGEDMPPSLPPAVARLLPTARLVNTYGPTETTIDATYHWLTPDTTLHGRVPLGHPVPGTNAYVVDDHLRLLPPGVAGQLAIGGNQVGLGYLDDPLQTAQRFVADPFASAPGARIYLTGDRVCWDDAGAIEFLGRMDHQVKVRGNRVELEEVEAVLRTIPGVRDAVVDVQEKGTARARLVALVVADSGVTVRDLHQRSAHLLPPYMVPSAFGLVAALPRLSNGKVARQAFPPDALTPPAGAGEWQTETEARVGRVWMNLLGGASLDRDLPFLASGGTSLLIPVLQERLRDAFGVTLSIPELFGHTTIAAQAALADRRSAGTEVVPTVESGRGARRRDAYAGYAKRRGS